MKNWERLNEAHRSGDTAEIIRLVHMMALGVTSGDEEAAEASVDEIVKALTKGESIDNFSAWARAVIKRTASKVWAARKERLQRVVELDTARGMKDVETQAMSDMPDGCFCDQFSFDDLIFPTPDAATAYRMRLEGKTAAEIAEHFGTSAETMQKRMRRWAPQIDVDYEKRLEEAMEARNFVTKMLSQSRMKAVVEN